MSDLHQNHISTTHTIRASTCTKSLRYLDHTNIKSGCQSGRKLVTHNSMSNLPLDTNKQCVNKLFLKNLTYANKRFCWQLTVDCIIGII